MVLVKNFQEILNRKKLVIKWQVRRERENPFEVYKNPEGIKRQAFSTISLVFEFQRTRVASVKEK